jgi:AraC family transcriptional regulator
MVEKRQMVVDLETGETRPANPDAPLLSSANGPWSGILLEHLPAGRQLEMLEVAACDHVVGVQVGHPTVFEWRENGRFRAVDFRPGHAVLHPALMPLSFRTARSCEIVVMALEPKFVRCVAHELFDGSERLELKQLIEVNDPLLYGLAISLKDEAAAGYPGGRTYGEALAACLATHLVRRYSNAVGPAKVQRGGLSRHQLRRAIDFMHASLAQDVSLAAIATEAGLSPFHFARQFKQSTGLAPHQYLIRCRVERARELLLSRQDTAADIALQVGFCDQSHLTTHFKRVFGATPAIFRQRMGMRKIIG